MNLNNLILGLFLILFSVEVKSQHKFNNCTYSQCFEDYHGKKIIPYYDFVKQTFKNKLNMISSSQNLKSFELMIGESKNMIFQNGKYEVEIEFMVDSLFIPNSIHSSASGDSILDRDFELNQLVENKIVGRFEDKSNYLKFERIKSISIYFNNKKIEIPEACFKIFANPNKYKKFLALNPLQVYKDKNLNKILIYFTGDFSILKVEDDYVIEDLSKLYTAKIVVDLDRNLFDNIYLGENHLGKYCWPYCTPFWPF